MDASKPEPDNAQGYLRFPSFHEWRAQCGVNEEWWEREIKPARDRRDSTPDLFKRALEIVKRAAAVETGAIEGLYQADRGFTETVALELSAWQATLETKGPDTKALIEAQFRAYDFALDFATQREPVVVAWVRELHRQICAAQDAYRVRTPAGEQNHQLPKGEYKRHPNNVELPNGRTHWYAPPIDTAPEMERLCGEMATKDFAEAHPVLQASYAHYSLVAVHPFADGNGRVARALASVFFLRAASLPLLITADQKTEYFWTLARADEGAWQPFVNFLLQRGVDAARIAVSSMNAADSLQPPEGVERIRRLYETRGGFSLGDADSAARRLLDAFVEEVLKQFRDANPGGSYLTISGETTTIGGKPADKAYRYPVATPGSHRFRLEAKPPASADVTITVRVEIPRDGSLDDDLMLLANEGGVVFRAKMSELHPKLTSSLHLRLVIDVGTFVGEVLDAFHSVAGLSLRKRGY